MKQARKASKDDFILQQCPKGLGEGSGVIPEIPDEPRGSSSSSGLESNDEIEDISSDDERSEANDIEKFVKVEANKVNDEKTEEEKVTKEQTEDVHAKVNFINDNPDVSLTDVLNDQAKIEIQSMVEVLVLQENPNVQRPPLVDTNVTMIPETTTLSPKQPPPKRSKTKVILKKSKKPDAKVDANAVLQRLIKLEKKVDMMSKIDHSESINNLFKLTSKRYYRHLLMSSDPPADAEKDSKKRKRKDPDASSLKKSKDKEALSKEGKAPSKSFKTNKAIDAEEIVQDDAMESKELIEDDFVDTQEPTQDDAAPKQDWSKWFKQDVVERPETPDLEWSKELNADDAPKQNWFNGMVNAEKDLAIVDNLMGSIVDFTKFAKNCLKKDKITKAGLEGPSFNLLKGNYKN
ncbi:hypothetical protein Tco_0040888 [Tanacetum coccineum]